MMACLAPTKRFANKQTFHALLNLIGKCQSWKKYDQKAWGSTARYKINARLEQKNGRRQHSNRETHGNKQIWWTLCSCMSTSLIYSKRIIRSRMRSKVGVLRDSTEFNQWKLCVCQRLVLQFISETNWPTNAVQANPSHVSLSRMTRLDFDLIHDHWQAIARPRRQCYKAIQQWNIQ